MTAPDDTGLGLFDDTASAVGNFPTALRGYDRSAVDDYVRGLEAHAVSVRRRAAALENQTRELERALEEARQHAASDADYSTLGGRASEILRLAEEQAHDVVDQAMVDAERMKEEARREAVAVRSAANREGHDLKSDGIAQLEKVRTQLEADGATTLERVSIEADSLLAAGRRQAESMRREAEHAAQTVRQQAYLDTEELRRSVDREAADARQRIAVEREQAVAELRRIQEDASERTAALLAGATQHHEESATRLESDIAEAARIRSEALAEAEQLKLTAIKEAEDRIGAARKQAAAISERTQHEFDWRKQQLKRETDLLSQRKQAVLNQLASLSALAEQTAHAFPDIDELGEFGEDQGDRTVMLPPGLAPSLPAAAPRPDAPASEPVSSDDPLGDETVVMPAVRDIAPEPEEQPESEDPQPIEQPESVQEPDSKEPDSKEQQPEEQQPEEQQPEEQPEPEDESATDREEAQLDGDATIVVPPGHLPSRAARSGSNQD